MSVEITAELLAVQHGGIGSWQGETPPSFDARGVSDAVHRIRESCAIVSNPSTGGIGIAFGGEMTTSATAPYPVLATLPAMYPEWLGDRSFGETHGTRFAYVTGAMANGIATTTLVAEIARMGGLGFFGSAGLGLGQVEAAIDELSHALDGQGLDGQGLPWGANLIHSPNEPALEEAVAELYLRRGVRKVSAAAYMGLTPAIVRYAYSGVTQAADGTIHRPNMVFAKISRPEVATHFMRPAPTAMLDALVAAGKLTSAEAQLAARLPVAEDITVESDSGGHTDNRPLGPLFSSIQTVRDELQAFHQYERPIRLGAAGGIATPQAAASAFALGAAYVLSGTVNEACIESGLSAEGREMLAQADVADITMAPAADMFELGVDVQVLSRGTMFAIRAKHLYQLYRQYPSLEAIPLERAGVVERTILRSSLDEAWQATREFFLDRDPAEVERAEADPHHKMALTFRSYLGLSSRWAIEGVADRQLDYQIWCGPSMGAFNSWAAGSFLESASNRTVSQVARNLLEGAAVISRAQQLRTYGLPVPSHVFNYRPRPLG
ncbi:MAG: PfaD family polyunsaturated fatty acid/polyketide biosynthesis protein [Acidimicrobiales bacterium]